MKSFVLVFLFATTAFGRTGFGPTEQEWGYVTVRPNANLFWWLQQTAANVETYTDVPLVIWLQGGPGSSSTGFGNFGELGPLDADLNPRNFTWINKYNVLFVDNPVGTGYSYATATDGYVTTNRQIAEDFVVLLQGFYEVIPELKSTPLYIFCESYGGKMTAEIGLVVDQAIKAGTLDVNLVGIALGDSWISPVDSVLTWGPYLLSVGAVDQNGYERIQQSAEATKVAFDNGDFSKATDLWGMTESVIESETAGIDFYNILTKISGWGLTRKLFKPAPADDLDSKIEALMNGPVREALGLDRSWGSQSGVVFNMLYEDFMKPVIDIVEQVLNTTDLRVAVYNGQLDLIVDTPGTIKWVDELQFDGANNWKTAERETIVSANNIVEGYYKKVGNLAFYWVDRSGHMVPSDNPNAMDFILEDVISGNWGK